MFSLVLGLGNIGDKYVGTRHNVGFEVLARVAEELKGRKVRHHDHFVSTQVERGDRTVTLGWPTTYMNRSGSAVLEALEFLDLSPAQMLIVVDDFNLPLGALRFRAGGSDGGHNGLMSIVASLETDRFPRLRLGIGSPENADSVIDYVLGRFADNELEAARKMVATAAEAVIFAIDHRLQEAMSKYNMSPALPEDA